MNRRLRTISSKDVERILRRRGFILLRQRGSHKQYVGIVRGKKYRVTVITGQREFTPKTLRSMIQQSGLSEEEWLESL